MRADFAGTHDIHANTNDLLQRVVRLEDWTSTDVVTIFLGTFHEADLLGRQLLSEETWLATL